MARIELEAILSEKGRECSMDPPRDQSTWNTILRQIGTTYVGGPLEALKEYISNAADAGAKNITITLDRSRRGHSKIMISDDGTGMHLPANEEALVGKSASEYVGIDILADSILRLPKEIGNSARKFDSAAQGEKAIGALAWQTIGDCVAFVSKKRGHNTVGWACDYKRKGTDHNFTSKVIKEEDHPELRGYVNGDHGTTVIFSRVSKDVMKQLHPRTIQRDFGSRFRDLLRESGVRITVKERGSTYVVEPEEYQGKLLIKEKVETKYGPIAFEIYINPSRRGEVRVKQGIQTLVNDLTSKRGYLESDAWSSGFLTGQIKADWLTPSAGRQDMENDDKATVFFAAVRKYNKRIEEAVAKYKKANDPVERRNLYNAMSKAISALFQEHPEWENLLTGYRATKSGVSVEGQPGDGYAPPIPHGPSKGTGDTTPREPKDTEKKQESQRDGKPVDQTKPGTTKGRKSLTLRFQDSDELPIDEMSKFEEDMSLILFNNQHPVYLSVVGDSQRKKMYLAGLVGKELLSKIYSNPRHLADHIMEFQQAFLEYLPLN